MIINQKIFLPVKKKQVEIIAVYLSPQFVQVGFCLFFINEQVCLLKGPGSFYCTSIIEYLVNVKGHLILLMRNGFQSGDWCSHGTGNVNDFRVIKEAAICIDSWHPSFRKVFISYGRNVVISLFFSCQGVSFN